MSSVRTTSCVMGYYKTVIVQLQHFNRDSLPLLTPPFRTTGPIYHELDPTEIEAILSARNFSGPPIPPRERPVRDRDGPVYERIASVKRKLTLKLSTGSRIVTRVSVDGAYIIGEFTLSSFRHSCMYVKMLYESNYSLFPLYRSVETASSAQVLYHSLYRLRADVHRPGHAPFPPLPSGLGGTSFRRKLLIYTSGPC